MASKYAKKAKPAKFYAVAVGRSVGIFRHWSEAQRSVDRFSSHCHQDFESLQDAETFMPRNGIDYDTSQLASDANGAAAPKNPLALPANVRLHDILVPDIVITNVNDSETVYLLNSNSQSQPCIDDVDSVDDHPTPSDNDSDSVELDDHPTRPSYNDGASEPGS